MKPVLISLFFILLILSAFQIARGAKAEQSTNLSPDEVRSKKADHLQNSRHIRPPMDMEPPSIFQTASFGLG